MATGTNMQHERRGSDPRIAEILSGNNKILELLNERKTYQLLLEQRVETIEREVVGNDGEGGLKAIVTGHTARLNLALGGMAAIGFVGALLGWCMDRMLKLITR